MDRKLTPIEELALWASDRLRIAAPEPPHKRKAMWNRQYREGGRYKTLGVTTEVRDDIMRLARKYDLSASEILERALEYWESSRRS